LTALLKVRQSTRNTSPEQGETTCKVNIVATDDQAAEPVDGAPNEALPVDAKPAEKVKPAETVAPAEATPSAATPSEDAPTEAVPVEPVPVEPVPVDVVPVEVVPAEAVPVEPNPIEAEPASAEATAAESTPPADRAVPVPSAPLPVPTEPIHPAVVPTPPAKPSVPRSRPPKETKPWGRVDETGTVFVQEEGGERAVGQYPDGTPEEALAYFQRKFVELAGQVTLLEQRAGRGAPATDIAKAVNSLQASVSGANAVGDLAALQSRLDALGGAVTELTEKQSEEAKAAVQAAIVERTAIVVEAEALAAADPAKAQWKQVSATLDELFLRWQKHQNDGPRLPKSESNELWKRFRAARGTIDGHRKAFFAELDSTHKDARTRKQELVTQAEALVVKGPDGIAPYRGLLDEWKLAGRAGKKFDDTLWARFKAAGDAIYSAKSEIDARDNVEFEANLALKLELLTEAEPLLTATDRVQAKDKLISIQRRWDAIGKVPREKVKTVEDRLRKVETAVRKLDEDHWQRSNPEKQARSEGLASQLHSAIAKLERELEEAKANGDKKKIAEAQEALDARKVWLDALGSN
jgi:hypothetical protein